MINNSLYTPPQAELQTVVELPLQYCNSTLTASRLKFLGWITTVYLILDIPLTGFYTMSPFIDDIAQYDTFLDILSLFSIFIWSYLMLMFRKFLNLRLNFHRVDLLIGISISMSFLMGIIPFASLNTEVIRGFSLQDLFFVVMLIPYGLVTILLGKRLLT